MWNRIFEVDLNFEVMFRFSDRPRHPKHSSGEGRGAQRFRPRLRDSRFVQRDRQRELPFVDVLHPNYDGRAGEEVPMESVRRHQGDVKTSVRLKNLKV